MSDKELEGVIDVLRRDKSFLQQNFGLTSIGIFGSFARGMQSPSSDIDFIVELNKPSFDFLAGLQIYLEEKLSRPVELIRKREGLSEKFLKRIEKDIHYV